MHRAKAATLTTMLGTAAAAHALLAGPAFGQTGDPADPQAQAEAGGSDAGGDIVVTAQRRVERLQDVPVAVTALGTEELTQLGARDVQDVARVTPGLVFVPGALGSGGSPIIRGISSQVGAATVGFYIDDTPLQIRPQPFSGNPDPKLFDIDRVEVLRGPQGTLFGASSMGGTIRYLTTQPSFSEWTGRARAEIAGVSHGEPNYEAAAAFGGPLAEDIGIRASAFYRRDGGFLDRVNRVGGTVAKKDVNSADTIALRLATEFRPLDGLRIQPSVFFQQTKRDDIGLFQPNLGGLRQNFVTPQNGKDRFVLPSLLVEYDFGGATLTSVTSGFSRRDKQLLDYSYVVPNLVFIPLSRALTPNRVLGEILPGFENYVATSDNAIEQRVFSQEVRLTSNDDGPFRWIIGGFYRRSVETFEQLVADQSFDPAARALFGLPANTILTGLLRAPALLPGNAVFVGDTRSTEKQLAAFGEASYDITDALSVTAGVRWSEAELKFRRVQSGPFAGSGAGQVSGEQKDHPITPKFSVNYKLAPDVLTYVTAQRGFRVGGVNPPVPADRCAADINALGGNPPPNSFNADSLWSYEAGLKSQFLDRRVTFNASVYRIDWKNIQQLLQLPGCGFGYTDNLGEARIHGAELETSVRPIEGLSLGAKVAYTDAKFSQDALAAPNPTTGVRAVIARDGDRVPGVPRWTYALTGQYQTEVAPDWSVYVRGDHQFIGKSFRTLPQGRAGYTAAIFRAESYETTSLRLGAMHQGWDISAFVLNLFDNRPLIGASTNLSPTVQTVRGTTLRPRTIGLTVAKDF